MSRPGTVLALLLAAACLVAAQEPPASEAPPPAPEQEAPRARPGPRPRPPESPRRPSSWFGGRIRLPRLPEPRVPELPELPSVRRAAGNPELVPQLPEPPRLGRVRPSNEQVVATVTSMTDLPAAMGLPTIDPEYHTPLAGREYHTTLFDEPIDIDARDRRDVTAISLGATVFSPDIGDQAVVPFAAFFFRRYWEERNVRAVVSGLVNEVDYVEKLPGGFGFEGLAHLENYTIPFPTTEIVDGKNLEFTALTWGWESLWLGGGWRLPLPPGEFDNDVSLQLFYKASYLHFASADDGDPTLNTPPDTYAHGFRVRFRLDTIVRNLLELPHRGIAGGVDAEWVRRDVWEDHGPILQPSGERQFLERHTRDYAKVSGYVVGAFGLPFLSERHRFVAQLHAAWAPRRALDRFSAFRFGGGPPPTEAGDLYRSPYAGAMFDQFVVFDGLVASLEYRFELLFFLFFHLRATLAQGRIPTYHNTVGPPAPVRIDNRQGSSYSAAITSGFLWSSVLYLEYSYDNGALRAGEEGHSVLVMWSKSF